MDTNTWHQRFLIQSKWTAYVQTYLLQSIADRQDKRAIEIGSGTGAILQRLAGQFASLYGLDLDLEFLTFAQQTLSNPLICANGLNIPFASSSFDIVCCHFLLLWVSTPEKLLAEAYRILSKNGTVMLLAEPDYGARIDYPPPLEKLGVLQTSSLRYQGADPSIGRQLVDLVSQAGFSDIQAGIMGNQWQTGVDQTQWTSEWEMFEHDLAQFISPSELNELKQIDYQAYQQNKRVLYIPTFYALARK